MDLDDSPQFLCRLVAIGEYFDAELSSVKQAQYFEALDDLPLDLVLRALKLSMRSCTFMPKASELRRLVLGDDVDQAEQAWMAFRLACRSAGSYSSLVLTDPALAETLITVFESWPKACAIDLSPEMWASKRKEFGRVYSVILGRQLHGPRYLAGLCEIQNGSHDEWLSYVPVHRLDGHTIEALTRDQAQAARAAMAGGRPLLPQPAVYLGETAP